ncbi:NADH-quinone oxidoreductase subunit A|uniref:NADH-quinone oxidoreductase subunit A n=1 Tax=Dendrosporobacter quercicolus TaxID=146817 RepID=A0A1G9QCU5_9FIRM|nr:NADH-quinone oxidoreductase subunit A [Dendrosporobacter quercicolus]NSL48190.1 NADH-quinone oxidoreductase subunit A [Dendrosporobacter quercicolus DSM 1736]SDM08551.1 NADH dehydrogenase subunit A [Dendrosporobacter quercicolus]
MLQDYGNIAIFLVIAVVFPLLALGASAFIHPRRPSAAKSLPYECGVDTVGSTWVQFRASYFLYALVFVVFDIETIFLYLWAVVFQQLGRFAFIEMFIFIGILTLGLAYAWKKGALEWK